MSDRIPKRQIKPERIVRNASSKPAVRNPQPEEEKKERYALGQVIDIEKAYWNVFKEPFPRSHTFGSTKEKEDES